MSHARPRMQDVEPLGNISSPTSCLATDPTLMLFHAELARGASGTGPPLPKAQTPPEPDARTGHGQQTT